MSDSRVSVLMSVYNGQKYLREAIDSILVQTFTNFEFLIIDDCSTDDTPQIINSYRDRRIRYIRNESNLGLAAALNRGLDSARGEYIARMDADDVSLPDRLARQVDFMDNHPETGVCGSWVKTTGELRGRIWRYPVDPDSIVCGLLFEPPLAHPSVMMRRQLFRQNGLYYDPLFKRAQDYDLWVRASEVLSFANIDEVLLFYRIHPWQAGQGHAEEQQAAAGSVRKALLGRLGLAPSAEEFQLHQYISALRFQAAREILLRAEAWLYKIKAANDETPVYPEPAFSRVLGRRWFAVCNKAAKGLGLWAWKRFWASGLSKWSRLGLEDRAKLFVNALIKPEKK